MPDYYMIIVSGTPGTGKTQVARLLAEDLGLRYVSSSVILKELGAAKPDPTGRYTYLVSGEGVRRALETLRNARIPVVLETVYPSLWLEAGDEDTVFVVLLRTDPFELYERLARRGWPPEKIAENVLAEILGVVASDLADYWHMVFEVDTTGKSADRVVENLYEKVLRWDAGFKIDWLTREDVGQLAVRLEASVDFDKYWLGYSG
ncbi:MAG: adenylate kinase family protein [Desulfurococcales archaeon]|nr:adenylate kinase family protein [Desulfurococcales archaeon]